MSFSKAALYIAPSKVGIRNYGLQAKPGPLPVFESKVMLEHSPSHSFLDCLQLLLHYKIKVEYSGDLWITNPDIFTTWLFTEKVCQPLN